MKLLILVVAITAPALGQDLSSRMPIGAEVKLRTRGLIVSSVKGRIAAVDSDHVRLALTKLGSTVQLPWRNVESLEWTRGRNRGRGLLEGALFGLMLGASVFGSNYPFALPDDHPDKATQIRRAAQVSTIIAVGSAVIGAAVGARRWDGAPIPTSRGGVIALDLAAGDELRVESALGRLTGRNGIAGDSLRLTTRSGPVALSWRSVGELEVRAGRNRVVGILIGAGIGFAASGIAESFMDVGTGGVVTNVAAGGLLGFRYLTPDGWKSVPLPNR